MWRHNAVNSAMTDSSLKGKNMQFIFLLKPLILIGICFDFLHEVSSSVSKFKTPSFVKFMKSLFCVKFKYY